MTKISRNYIKPQSISQTEMAPASVGPTQLQPNAVSNSHVIDRTLDRIKLALETITHEELAPNSVTGVKIADTSLIQRHFSTGSVPQTALQKPSVGTPELINDSVTIDKLADDSVGSNQLADQSVYPNHLAPNLIGDDTIPVNTISPNRLKNASANGALLYTSGADTAWRELTPAPTSGQYVLSTASGIPTWTSSLVFTGVVIDYVGTSAPSGWIFANGKTIGPALSGATGRAHADTYNLFMLMWNSGAAVSPSKGASAQADWDAGNKTVTIPDLRGRTTVGRAGMDNSVVTTLSSDSVTNSKTTDDIGATGGLSRFNMTSSMLPAHTHFCWQAGTLSGESFPLVSPTQSAAAGRGDVGGSAYFMGGYHANPEPSVGPTSTTGTGGAEGAPHENMPPFYTVSKLIRL